MFKIYSKHIFVLLVIVIAVLTNSCSEYSKLVKSSDYELKYTKAVEYYEAGAYYKAQALFEDLKGIYRATDKAQKVAYYNAYCSYGLGEYSLAAYLFKDFVRIYLSSEYAEEVSYIAAYCYYLNSPE